MWYRVWSTLVAVALVAVLLGCSEYSHRDERHRAGDRALTVAELPPPVQATVRRLVGAGETIKLEKEETDSGVVYDLEARVQGKNVEYDIGGDGTVLSREESVAFTSLPAAVRAAAEKHFGSAEGLKAAIEVEQGKTFYEVEGPRGKEKGSVKFAETGAVIEVEED